MPTRFNALTFAQAGVSPDRLHVLPEPVDTALFSPAAAKPPAASDGGLRFEGVGTLHPIVAVLPCVHAPAPVAQPALHRQSCFCHLFCSGAVLHAGSNMLCLQRLTSV